MLAITRKNLIKEMIQEKKSVTVIELSQKFSVTTETIRSDLKDLESEGFLKRSYGGAYIQEGVENNVKISIRKQAYIESKNNIAHACMQFINNGDSIFLDSSTTALALAKRISNMRLTVITNSLLIINELYENSNIRLVVIGGDFNPADMAFTSFKSIESLSSYYFDKAFISCRTLSMQNGITDSTESIAAIRRTVIQRCNQIYLLADHSKFNHTSFIHVCDYNDINCIISDYQPTEEWNNFLSEHGVSYYKAVKEDE